MKVVLLVALVALAVGLPVKDTRAETTNNENVLAITAVKNIKTENKETSKPDPKGLQLYLDAAHGLEKVITGLSAEGTQTFWKRHLHLVQLMTDEILTLQHEEPTNDTKKSEAKLSKKPAELRLAQRSRTRTKWGENGVFPPLNPGGGYGPPPIYQMDEEVTLA